MKNIKFYLKAVRCVTLLSVLLFSPLVSYFRGGPEHPARTSQIAGFHGRLEYEYAFNDRPTGHNGYRHSTIPVVGHRPDHPPHPAVRRPDWFSGADLLR